MELTAFNDEFRFPQAVDGCAWCPKRDLMAVLFRDGQLSIYRVWEEARVLDDHGCAGSMAWSPDGSTLAFVGVGGICSLYDVDSNARTTFSTTLAQGETVTLLDWHKALGEMTVLAIGTSLGKLVLTLNGTLLINECTVTGSHAISSNSAIVASVLAADSFASLAITASHSVALQKCRLLTKHAEELGEMATKHSQMDAQLHFVQDLFSELTIKLQEVETLTFGKLRLAIDCAFDGADGIVDFITEIPSESDWIDFVILGTSTVDIIQPLTTSLTRANLATFQQSFNSAKSNITTCLRKISTSTEVILVMISELSNYSLFNPLFPVKKNAESTRGIMGEFCGDLQRISGSFMYHSKRFQTLLSFLQQILFADESPDNLEAFDIPTVNCWFDSPPRTSALAERPKVLLDQAVQRSSDLFEELTIFSGPEIIFQEPARFVAKFQDRRCVLFANDAIPNQCDCIANSSCSIYPRRQQCSATHHNKCKSRKSRQFQND